MQKMNNLYDVKISLRISSKQSDYLDKLAKTYNKKSQSDAIRLLIDDYIVKIEAYERRFEN